MKLAAYLAVLSIAAFSSVLASDPQPPAAQPPAAQAPAAQPPAADAVGSNPAKTEKVDSANSKITDAQIKQMRGRGYKPVLRNGTLVFCRSEHQIGSHFDATRCNTIDELNQAEQTGKEYVNSIQQQGSPTQFKGP